MKLKRRPFLSSLKLSGVLAVVVGGSVFPRAQTTVTPTLPVGLDSTFVVPAGRGSAFPTTLGGAFPASLGGEGVFSPATAINRAALPPQALRPIQPLVAEEAIGLREVLYALTLRTGVPITVEEGLEKQVVVTLPAVPLVDALGLLCRQEGLALVQTEDGFHVLRPEHVAAWSAERERTTAVAVNAATANPARSSGTVQLPTTGALSEADATGILPVLPNSTHSPGGIAPGIQTESAASSSDRPVAPGVHVRDGLVSLSVEETPLSDVLRDLARQANLSLVASSGAEGTITARWVDVPLSNALGILLTGTNLTYRQEGATLVIADRQLPSMLTSRLIPLRHVPAGGLVEQMPDALRQQATFQLVQEQNAVIVTAPADVVAATEAYLAEIDHPSDQILLEVLVVEFETSGLREMGVSFLGGLLPDGTTMPESGGPGWISYLFGGGNDQRGGLDVIGDGETANGFLNFWSDVLGIRSIGRLPTDFYFRLQALEHSGKAEIQSRPHIATLNGHTANISVGTSQYYILKSLSPYQGSGGPFGQGAESEHFEYVQADVRLEITPWVTEDRGVTASIHPSFTTPVGAFDPRVPPTLRNWSVDTNVRLEDGETFMIGGLIQEQEHVSENRIPILGSLPLIGPLFRNSHRETRTGELVIFITPHILGAPTPGGGSSSESEDALYERLAPRGRRAAQPLVTPERVW